jgi:hypothetical protein
MSKLLEIDNCYDCKYCSRAAGVCFHPEIKSRMINSVKGIYFEIPSWCPLPDAGENNLTHTCLLHNYTGTGPCSACEQLKKIAGDKHEL